MDKQDELSYEKLGIPTIIGEKIQEAMQGKEGEDRELIVMSMLEALEYATGLNQPATPNVEWSPLNDLKRRKRIEGKLSKLDMTEYVRKGYVEQEIVLQEEDKAAGRPKMSIKLRSVRPVDTSFLEGWSVEDNTGENKDELVQMLSNTPSWQSMNELCLSLVAINGEDLETVFVLNETLGIPVPKLELCQKRRAMLANMPESVVLDYMLNLDWFKSRVINMHGAASIQGF